ncbi:MAG: type IV pilus assembly protein PilM [Candidatus Kerfeldbacteria bacterium]|nr:type IV pilus assembly protein PilM [Candidatus Kerfeldbacteria bacterium]
MANNSVAHYFTNPSRRTVGLDLTGRYLRHVRLKRRGGAVAVVGFGQGPELTSVIQHGAVVDRPGLTALIRETIGSARVSSAVIVIPERHVFIKTFDLPSTQTSDLAEAVRWEASQYIPFDMNELYLDWRVASQDNARRITVTAAPRLVVDDFTFAVEAAGLTPLAVEGASYACLRVLRATRPQSTTVMAVHLGEIESTALLLEQGTPIFSAAVNETTAALERVLSARFSLSPSEAHEARVLLGFSSQRAYGLVRKVLLDELRKLTTRINEIVSFHNEHALTDDPLSEIVVAGPGSETVGLGEVLSQEIHIPSGVLPAWPHLQLTSHTKKFADDYQSYLIALSAAARTLTS